LDAAEKTFRALANASPAWDDNHGYLAAIALARGDRDAALREAKLEVSVDAQAVALVLVYQATGQRAKAEETLAHIEPYSRDIWPTGIAIAFAHLGEIDQAFAWLERAREQRDPEMLMEIRSDYLVGSLRADPRYRNLLRSLNLSE
jgi:tetratricopeptide (TPR) repeat protein